MDRSKRVEAGCRDVPTNARAGRVVGNPAAPVDFPFTIGAREVIRRVDEGVVGMRVGGERTLVITPNPGYGSRAFDPIPENAVIVFDTRLLSVSTRSDPEGVRLAPREPRPSWREAHP